MSYAVTAFIVAFIVRLGDKVMTGAFYFFGGFHILLILLIFISTLQGAGVSLNGMASVTELYEHGTWFAQVQHRLTNFLFYRSEAIFIIPMNVFLFLLGVRFMRNGVFSPTDKGRQTRQKLFKIGVFIGFPINLLIFSAKVKPKISIKGSTIMLSKVIRTKATRDAASSLQSRCHKAM